MGRDSLTLSHSYLEDGPPTPGILSIGKPRQPRSRRSLWSAATVVFLLLCAFFYLWPSEGRAPSSIRRRGSRRSSSKSSTWEYSYDEHANFHGLTDEQCDVAFPHLFDKLEEQAARREKKGIIEPDEVDFGDQLCLVRVLVFNAELYIISGATNEGCWITHWHEITSGLLNSLHRAIVAAPPSTIPDAEFILDLDDNPQRPIDFLHGEGSTRLSVFGLTKKRDQHNIWLMPDYSHWAWPSANVGSHALMRRAVNDVNAEYGWDNKTPKTVWRGITELNSKLREPLLNITKNEDWADVEICDVNDEETKDNCMPLHEHCRYKFPIHTEGYTYSGRLKYLQLCNSAPIIHKLTWEEHHTHLLKASGPEQNYIGVEKDWSDLPARMEYYLDHDEAAERVANNSYKAFYERYLTPAATSCYWRRAISAWSSVQGWDPQLFEMDKESGTLKTRGVTFEAYAIDPQTPMPGGE